MSLPGYFSALKHSVFSRKFQKLPPQPPADTYYQLIFTQSLKFKSKTAGYRGSFRLRNVSVKMNN